MPVVITGLGLLSPYGIGTLPLLRGLLQGVPAPRSHGPESRSGELDDPGFASIDRDDIGAVLGAERRRELNAETEALLAATRLALSDAGLEQVQSDGTGISVSTRHAGLQDYAELYSAGMSGRLGAVSPARGPQTGLNAPAAHLSIRLKACGPNMTISNGGVGGLDALSFAVDALRAGRAEMMVVGGVEVLPRVATALSSRHTALPGTPWARPFDRRRDGSTHGEAGVALILEDERSARRRGARVRAEVSSVASAFSPNNSLADASRRSLVVALEASSCDPRWVVAGFAGANGSRPGDAAEAHAWHELVGEHVPICAIKGALADSGGAAALTQVTLATLALEQQVVPATMGFSQRDRDLPTLDILTAPRAVDQGPVLVHTWDDECCASSAVLNADRRRRSHTRDERRRSTCAR